MDRPQARCFKFVIQDPTAAFDEQTRREIRQHAAEFTHEINYAPEPKQCAPNYSPNTASIASFDRSMSGSHHCETQSNLRDQGLDDIDLSALTSLHVGDRASRIILSDPSRLREFLSCRQDSYLSLVPPQRGASSVLDDAFGSLMAIASFLVNKDTGLNSEKALVCYSKALGSLQSAMYDNAARHSPELLCATYILALFELLNAGDGSAWGQHIAGAADLIRFRGPSAFVSNFDKSLLVSLSYPICTEAFLNDRHCFLEQSHWIDVLLTSITADAEFTHRSALAIYLIIIKVKVPGLVHRTTRAVEMQDSLKPAVLEGIVGNLLSARSNLHRWRVRFNNALMHYTLKRTGSSTGFDKRWELLGMWLVLAMLVGRLLVAIQPQARFLLEEEVQNYALEFTALQESQEYNRHTGLFLQEKEKVACTVIATHAEFRELVHSSKIIDARRLQAFFEMIGRRRFGGVVSL